MTQKRYPIGIQTFSDIIEGEYSYVDKTAFIPKLFQVGRFIFLSRPRRFGKSLLLSTLEAYFEGRRELFEGLDLSRLDVEWKRRPVVHIDLNGQNYTLEDGLPALLNFILGEYEKQYGITPTDMMLSVRFASLIKGVYEKTGEKVVILVDEYDKPLLDIEDNPDLFSKNQAILKGFFGVLKSMDKYIDFAMLTGVARFNKVSIFSDLNNLNDISLDNDFADICGWTEKELLENFRAGIEKLAEDNEKTYDEAVESLRYYYDGYRFAPLGNRLYNPYSVLKALSSRQIRSYWFQTGTPTFLAKRIKAKGIELSSLNSQWREEPDLLSVNLNDSDPIPLLFQTGYLTIKEVDGDMYELKFPNREVEIGFARNLSPLYVPDLYDWNGDFSLRHFILDIRNGEPEKFMLRLQTMLKNIPYEKHDEQLYQNAVYLLFTLLGTDARMEEHSNLGSTDLTVRTKDYIYLFEFKYNRSAREALEQIHARDYAGRFTLDSRTLILIGANFSREARGLTDWIIER